MNNLYHSVINITLHINADNFEDARKLARKFNTSIRLCDKAEVESMVLPYKLTCSLVSIKSAADRQKQYDALIVLALFTVAQCRAEAHQFAGTSSERVRQEFRAAKAKYLGVSLTSKVIATQHLKRLLKTDRRIKVERGTICLE